MRAAEATILKWAEDPIAFAGDVFGVALDPWQSEALREFAKPSCDHMAIQSCKGPGKTFVEGLLIWWFAMTRPKAKIYATSITGKNLRDNLWAELAKLMELSRERNGIIPEAFEWGSQRIVNKKMPGAWFISARTWERSANSDQQSEGLAGAHGDYTAMFLDEVSGIPDAVVETAEASLSTGIENKIFIAGNPLYLKGPLYRAVKKESHIWYVIRITADPDDPRRASRVKIEYAKRQIEKWGRDHPFVRVNIFGEFPSVAINALLGPEEIEQARNRMLRPDEYFYGQRRTGLDVADYGEDPNMLCNRQGLKVHPFQERRNIKTEDKVAWVIENQRSFGAEIQFIDGTGGFGTGVFDGLNAAGMSFPGGLNPMMIKFNAKALSKDFVNKRAEMWWAMAQAVKNGASIPDDDELAEELQASYFFNGDAIQIEDKEDMKSRLGRSPNKADALALTYALPELRANPLLAMGPGQVPGGVMPGVGRPNGGRPGWDYDPFSNERTDWDKDPF